MRFRLQAGLWRLLVTRRTTVVAISVIAIAAGFAEATVLSLTAELASAMASGDEQVELSGFLGGSFSLSVGFAIGIVAAVVRVLLLLLSAVLSTRMTASIVGELRRSLADSYLHSDWPTKVQDSEGYLQELMSSHVYRTSLAVGAVSGGITAMAMFAVLTVTSFVVNPVVALSVFIVGSLLLASTRPLLTRSRRASSAQATASMEVSFRVSETVRMAEEISVFGSSNEIYRYLEDSIATSQLAVRKAELLGKVSQNLFQGAVLVLIVSGLCVLNAIDASDLGSLGAVILILIRASTYGQQFQGSLQSITASGPFVERLQSALDRYAQSRTHYGAATLSEVNRIDFESVSFEYNRQPVLTNVSFSIERGECIGIVGPSGAGKSTLVSLLLRLNQPTEGAVLVNGRNSDEFSMESWVRSVAFVPQEPKVFAGTVEENIRFWRPIDRDSVESAADQANLSHDVSKFPNGYKTVVGQRSNAVSGGQRQRISLARAMTGVPSLLILDEPTSALDPRSEEAVTRSLASLQGKTTLVIVSHRMSTLQGCDRIIVLRDGAIVDSGPPERVLRETQGYLDG